MSFVPAATSCRFAVDCMISPTPTPKHITDKTLEADHTK